MYSWAEVREPAVAGAFYAQDAVALKQQVRQYLENSVIDNDKLPSGGLIGVVVPHAGYPYSGQVAAYSFKLLEGLQFDTVVVIGPNHTVMGFNDVSVWSEGVFKTPLGLVPVDTELAKAIIASNHEKFVSYPRAHYREHSIEVELPFLQVVLSDFKIVLFPLQTRGNS